MSDLGGLTFVVFELPLDGPSFTAHFPRLPSLKLWELQQTPPHRIMSMEQIRAINALEPFVLLSKSATSPRAAADLITQATSSPHTYVFAELLQAPNIQALNKSEEYAAYLKLLETFAWGSFQDYQSKSLQTMNFQLSYNGSRPFDFKPHLTHPDTSNLPPLTPPQHQKLLLLSLLPLARNNKPLSYATLQQSLSLPSIESLETLIITALYASLLEGSLDPAAQVVHISSVAPLRDLRPGSVPALGGTFEAWSETCEGMLGDLGRQMDMVEAKARAKAVRDRRIKGMFEAKVEAYEEGGRGKRGLDAKERDGDEMDIDGDANVGRTRGKRSLMGVLGQRLGGGS